MSESAKLPGKLQSISSPDIIEIIQTIKKIQQRMKDSDICDLEFIYVYDKLGREFNEFSENHKVIFDHVIKGKSLDILAASLFYKDKFYKGEISESELSQLLANKFLPSNLMEESNKIMKEMSSKQSILNK